MTQDFSPDLYRSSDVEAIQVTAENAEWVAEWCNGRSTSRHFKGGISNWVHLTAADGGPRRLVLAKMGDWVVRQQDDQFRVFKNHVFKKVFHPVAKAVDVYGHQDLYVDSAEGLREVRNVFDNKEEEK